MDKVKRLNFVILYRQKGNTYGLPIPGLNHKVKATGWNAGLFSQFKWTWYGKPVTWYSARCVETGEIRTLTEYRARKYD